MLIEQHEGNYLKIEIKRKFQCLLTKMSADSLARRQCQDRFDPMIFDWNSNSNFAKNAILQRPVWISCLSGSFPRNCKENNGNHNDPGNH